MTIYDGRLSPFISVYLRERSFTIVVVRPGVDYCPHFFLQCKMMHYYRDG